MNIKIREHFKKNDPIIFKILEEIGNIEELTVALPREYFFRLCREIITQQLSNRVADIFIERFIALSLKQPIAPEHIIKLPEEKLRGIGISWAKVRYLKDLAHKIERKEVLLENLQDLEDQKVVEELTKIKGIGNWTAEMFLMFSLGRPDVFSHGDLGLKRAIEKIYNLKNPAKDKIETISLKWSPYRTWACRILWQSRDKK